MVVLDELTLARIARLDAEIQAARANGALAQRMLQEAETKLRTALERYVSLHRSVGLDADVHTILLEDTQTNDGRPVKAGTVVLRKNMALYEPPVSAPEPTNSTVTS